MANFVDYQGTDGNDYYFQWDSGFGSGNNIFAIGYDSTIPSTISGALRFQNILVNQGVSVNQAILSMRADFRVGTAPVKGIIYGIDEDNTANFTSAPGSRDRTSATKIGQYDPSGEGYWREDITSIVNEIFARGGWSSGNSIGFYIDDNGTDTGASNRISDQISTSPHSILSIRTSALPDFTPGPYSVSAKNPPTNGEFGVFVSKEGFEAVTNLQQHKNLTSDARVIKVAVSKQAGWPTNATSQSISHGLKYPPAFMAYALSNGRSFYAPYAALDLASDPSNSGSGVIAVYPQSTPETIDMIKDPNAADPDAWFYYVFIDENL